MGEFPDSLDDGERLGFGAQDDPIVAVFDRFVTYRGDEVGQEIDKSGLGEKTKLGVALLHQSVPRARRKASARSRVPS